MAKTENTDEQARLGALAGLRVVATPAQPEFDGIAAVAARLAAVPWAVVTFIDDEREWVKAGYGRDFDHVRRRVSLGDHVLERNGPLLIEDTSAEPALHTNPWVAEDPPVRFYAAVPIRTGDLAVGTLAVLAPDPRSAGDDLIDALTQAAEVLQPHLRRRREEAMAQNVTSRVDFEGRYLHVSPAVEKVLGWRPDEMIGHQVVEFLHPEDEEPEAARIARFTSGELTEGGSETRFRTKDGSYRWLYWTAELAPHEGAFYTAAKDITDRKRNELALRESEARYRMLAENVTDIVTGHDLDGTLTYISDTARMLTGWEPEETIGRNFYDFLHPDDLARAKAAHQALLDGRDGTRTEVRVRRNDGSYLWVEAISRVVRDQSSNPVGLQTTTRDISEAKAAVEALDEAREHFERIFASAPIGMVIVNAEGTIEQANEAYCRGLGYDEDELVGAHISKVLHPDELSDSERLLGEILANDAKVSVVKALVHKDGRVLWMRAGASALTEADGRRLMLASLQDVTDELRNAEEVRRAREEAERANLAKDQFLSRMSHELRTPMNAVLGFAQLLESEDLTHSQRESVGRILRGGYHLLNLVNDVLDISAIETGQLPIVRESVCASEAIRETVELMRPLADERSIRLNVDLPKTLIGMQANEQRLKQVLMNLTANAIKYSPSGADVTVRAERDNGATARIHVIDTGPGIPGDEIDRAFMPFERLGASRTTEGTGLGLPLSRSLVDRMGGSLTVESSPAGSTFTVELPLATDCMDPENPRPAAAEWTPEDDVRVGCLLYIEDNEDNVAVLERLCQRRGDLELHAAPHGDAGIELARRLHPEVIVLDLFLPDTTAHEVLRELRSDPELADIPVIVVTADVTKEHEPSVIAAGATAFLTKPLDLGRLQQELDRALASGRD